MIRDRFSWLSSTLRAAVDQDMRKDLSALKVPVLLVYGGNDPLIRLPEAELQQANGHPSRVMVLEGAQHFPMLENRNGFNRLLSDFLEAGDNLSALALKREWQRRLR